MNKSDQPIDKRTKPVNSRLNATSNAVCQRNQPENADPSFQDVNKSKTCQARVGNNRSIMHCTPKNQKKNHECDPTKVPLFPSLSVQAIGVKRSGPAPIGNMRTERDHAHSYQAKPKKQTPSKQRPTIVDVHQSRATATKQITSLNADPHSAVGPSNLQSSSATDIESIDANTKNNRATTNHHAVQLNNTNSARSESISLQSLESQSAQKRKMNELSLIASPAQSQSLSGQKRVKQNVQKTKVGSNVVLLPTPDIICTPVANKNKDALSKTTREKVNHPRSPSKVQAILAPSTLIIPPLSCIQDFPFVKPCSIMNKSINANANVCGISAPKKFPRIASSENAGSLQKQYKRKPHQTCNFESKSGGPQQLENKPSVISRVYSFPIAKLTSSEWKEHKKNLTLTPKESHFNLRKRNWKTKKKTNYNLWGETKEFCCVPPQYGIERFGAADEDRRPQGLPIAVDCKTKLWGPQDHFNQEAVVEALQTHFQSQKRGGIIEIPTSTGKTVLMAHIISTLLKMKTLVIVSQRSLMSQVHNRFQNAMPTARIGRIEQKNWDVKNKDVVIAMLQTLAKQDELSSDVFDEFGAVIFDEVHLAATKHFSRVLYKLAHIRYMIGLSATTERADGMERLFFLFMGPWIFRAPMETKDSIRTTLQPLLYNEGDQTTIYTFQDPTAPDPGRMLKRKLADSTRHSRALDLLDSLYNQGRRVLVIVQGVEYGKKLVQDSQTRHPARKMIHYKATLKEAERVVVDKQEHDLVVGTYSILSTGIDLGYVDTLVMLSSRRNIAQTVGRLRSFSNWERHPLLIIDVVDNFGIFYNQYQARKRVYRKRKYNLLPELDWEELSPTHSFWTKNQQAAREILLQSGQLEESKSGRKRKQTKNLPEEAYSSISSSSLLSSSSSRLTKLTKLAAKTMIQPSPAVDSFFVVSDSEEES